MESEKTFQVFHSSIDFQVDIWSHTEFILQDEWEACKYSTPCKKVRSFDFYKIISNGIDIKGKFSE